MKFTSTFVILDAIFSFMQDLFNRKVLKVSVKIHLCAFADSRLKKSSDRLLSQARKFGGFESIRMFDETDLDEAFREEFRDKLRPDVRGFGYWVWKPQIILQTLAAAEQDSIILYLDIGCHLNPPNFDTSERDLSGFRRLTLEISMG